MLFSAVLRQHKAPSSEGAQEVMPLSKPKALVPDFSFKKLFDMASHVKTLPGDGTDVSVRASKRNRSSFCLLFLPKTVRYGFSRKDVTGRRHRRVRKSFKAEQKFFLPTFSFKKKYGAYFFFQEKVGQSQSGGLSAEISRRNSVGERPVKARKRCRISETLEYPPRSHISLIVRSVSASSAMV